MRTLALIASILVITLTGLLVIKSTDPQLYLKIALTFDINNDGIDAQAEKSRLEKIDLLPIADAKKAILANKTIFLGASPNMVRLALGEPKETRDGKTENALFWMYHFDNDMLPTTLAFENNKLVSAYSADSR